MARLRIGELLVSSRLISQAQLDGALRLPRKEGERLGDVLVAQGLVTEAQLTQTLSQQLSVPWVSLRHIEFSRQLLNLVPREVAEKFSLVPIFVRRVRKQGDTLYVAMTDPTNEAALTETAQFAGLPVRPMIAGPTDIHAAIRVYYGGEKGEPRTPPPVAPRASQAQTVKSDPPSVEDLAPQPPSPSGDSPDAAPEIEAMEHEIILPKPRRGGGMPMVALTLLDGTTVQLPARPTRKASDAATTSEERAALTARDLIAALRAVSQGKDASAVIGEDVKWEALFGALLSLLLRKGLIADWEFIEELRKLGG